MKLLQLSLLSVIINCCLLLGCSQELYAQKVTHDLAQTAQDFEAGKILAKALKLDSAILLLKRSAHDYESVSDWLKFIDSNNYLCRALTEDGQYTEAALLLRKGLRMAEEHALSEHALIGRTLQLIGDLYIESGQLDSAEYFLDKSLKNTVSNFGVNSPEVDDIYYSFCRLHFYKDEYPITEKYAKTLLSGRERYQSGPVKRAQAYNVIAIIYYLKADYYNAKLYFELGLKEFKGDETIHDLNFYYTMLENLGAMEFLSGNYERANQYYTKGLEWRLAYLPPDHAFTSSSYFNIAEVHDRRGEYEEAVRLYKKCIDMRHKIYDTNHPQLSEAYIYLGMTYYHQGNTEKALTALKTALGITKNVQGSLVSTADLYEQLGDVYMSIEVYDSSEYYYDLAFGLLEQKYGIQHPRVAAALQRKSTLYRNMGDLELSIYEGYKALNVVTKPPSGQMTMKDVLYPTESIEVLRHLAFTQRLAFTEGIREVEVLNSALHQVQLAIELILEKRVLIFDQKVQQEFSERYVPVYEEGLRIVSLLYQHTGDSKYLQVAFEMIEGSKVFNLTRSVLSSSSPIEYFLPDSLSQKEHLLKVEISYLNQKILNLKGGQSGYDSLIVQGYEDQLFDLKRDFEKLKFQLETDHPRYHKLQYNFQTKSVAEIQDDLGERSQLLDFFWTDSTLFVMGIYPETISLQEISIDSSFLNNLEHLNSGFIDSKTELTPDEFGELSNAVYRTIFDNNPVAPAAGQKLIIIPDGLLSHLNFDLLVSEPPAVGSEWKDLQYLIKDYAILTGYSASLIFNDRPKSDNTEKDLLAFSFGEQNEDPGNHLSMEVVRSSNLAALPGSIKEVKNIADMVEGDYYYGQFASEETFKEVSPDYQILHLAVHGSVNEDNPDYSKLHFHAKDTIEDGRLHVFELYNMELNADLAVLSACNTGSGKYQTGEGIMSLGHAFSYAGVNSLLLTRWDLSDEAAPEIMKVFYRELKAGKPKSEALRIAKLQYLQEASLFRSNPFYWGSFFVLGDDSPVNFKRSLGIQYWIAGIILMMVAFGFIRRRKTNLSRKEAA